MQKILNVSTTTDSLRADIDGWSAFDGDKVVEACVDHKDKYTKWTIPVGLIRSLWQVQYPTVLHAIGDGWKLLAPPQKFTWENRDGKEITGYSWWLVKD